VRRPVTPSPGRAAGRGLALAGALAGALLLPAGAGAVAIADGHADYAARLIDGRLRTQVRDPSGAWHDPATVTVRVVEAARSAVPGDARFRFLGSPGASVWVLPQTERPGVAWLGWSAESLVAPRATGAVGWSLDAVEGPGTVALYQQNALGDPAVLFDSGDGLPDAHQLALGAHAHGSWAFSQPGRYRLTTTHRATIDGAPQSDTRTLEVVVDGTADAPAAPVPVPPSAPPATGAGPPAAPVRTALPVVRTTAARMSSRRTVAVRLRCAAATPCRGRLRLRTAGRVRHAGTRRVLTLGARRVDVRAGRAVTVRLRVPVRVARSLRAGRPSRPMLRASVRQGDAVATRRFRVAVR